MSLNPQDAACLDRIDGDALVARAAQWAQINSGSRNRPGLERMLAALKPELERLGGEVETTPLPTVTEVGADGVVRSVESAPALRLRLRPEATTQVALTGHYDTVYPADSPFQTVTTRADGALNGPGIADMKGGLSVMIGALAAFETHADAHRVGWTVLISPDEETGSLGSAPLLAELGARAHVGLTFEPALADGRLASARKGSENFHLVVWGRSAHAGRAFAEGRNAVAAAARAAVALHALNGRREGVTVNVARIDGGAPLNQVPDAAVVRFNLRLPDEAAGVWALAEFDRITAETAADGVTAELHGGLTRPPKPFVPAQQALFEAARDAAGELGQTLDWQPSGGVCEGNNLFAAGCPGVDTLGVRGGDIHSEAEHAWPDSFAERARLTTLLLIRLATGEIDGPGLRAALGRDLSLGVTPVVSLG
ncbi:hydrolase [soil metagenome]